MEAICSGLPTLDTDVCPLVYGDGFKSYPSPLRVIDSLFFLVEIEKNVAPILHRPFSSANVDIATDLFDDFWILG